MDIRDIIAEEHSNIKTASSTVKTYDFEPGHGYVLIVKEGANIRVKGVGSWGKITRFFQKAKNDSKKIVYADAKSLTGSRPEDITSDYFGTDDVFIIDQDLWALTACAVGDVDEASIQALGYRKA